MPACPGHVSGLHDWQWLRNEPGQAVYQCRNQLCGALIATPGGPPQQIPWQPPRPDISREELIIRDRALDAEQSG